VHAASQCRTTKFHPRHFFWFSKRGRICDG